MSTVKVTVTLGSDELAQVRALVREGQVANVSAFVQHAVRRSLDDVAGWAGVLAAALEGTGGPLTPAEIEWADEVLAGAHLPDPGGSGSVPHPGSSSAPSTVESGSSPESGRGVA
jgi:Arc/MetJ-type ribon-helix-helix transcriptional regulator